jgi:hypothetical protein
MARYDQLLAKLGRAEEHLNEAKETVRSFRDEYLPDLPGWVGPEGIGVDVQAVPPPRLAAVIADCVHNLRSALDHLAGYLLESHNSQPTERTGFPLVMDARSRLPIMAEFTGVLPQAVLDLLDVVQPYKLGDVADAHELWILHQLWNADKHRSLLTESLSVHNADFVANRQVSNRVTGVWTIERPTDDGGEYRFVPEPPALLIQSRCFFEIGFV